MFHLASVMLEVMCKGKSQVDEDVSFLSFTQELFPILYKYKAEVKSCGIINS